MEYLRKIQELQRLKGTEEGLYVLLEALKESDFRVRKVALEGLLQNYPRDRLIRYFIEFLYIEDNAAARNTAIEALIAIGPQALRALEGAFETDNADVRKFIVDIAGQMNTALSVPLLLKAIQDQDDNVRAAAVEYIGRLKATEAVGSLIKMLHEEDLWVKYSVIETLGKIGTKETLPAIADALTDRALTEVALRALSNFRDPRLISKIVPYLKDKRRSVVSQALVTLSKIADSEEEIRVLKTELQRQMSAEDLIKRLKDALRTSDQQLKKAAVKLLGFFGRGKEVEVLLDMAMQEEMAQVVEEALKRIGKRAPHVLESYLWKGYPEKKRFVARTMASLKSPLFYGSFLKALSEVDGHVVAIAARALAEMGDRQCVERLIPLLGHPYPDVQDAVVEALVKLGQYLHTEELRTLLHSPSETVRANAALVAGRLKKKALIGDLGLLTGDPSALVRKAVGEALAEIGTDEALQFLRRCLKDEEPEVRIAALSSISGVAPKWLAEEIKPIISDPVPSVRVAAIRALARTKTRESIGLLRSLLTEEDPYIIVHAIEALQDDLSSSTTQAIKDLLKHPDREVRRTAIEALALRAEEQTVMPYLLSDDWAIRLAAVKALSRYPSKSSKKALRELYQVEQDPLIRNTIRRVLDASN